MCQDPVEPLTPLSSPLPDAAERARGEASAADALAAAGQFAQARQRYAEALRLQPGDAHYHWISGIFEWRLGDADSAGALLQQAVRLNPEFAFGQASLGEWFLTQGMVSEALAASARAQQLEPDNPGVMSVRATILQAAGELDDAWNLVQRLVAANHLSPGIVTLNGRLARGRGHGSEEQALRLITQFVEQGALSPADQATLDFTAADLLEGLGRYDEAFAHAQRGNSVRRSVYDPQAHKEMTDRLIAYFTRRRVRSLPKAVYRGDKPVFIVGMPRSGTSLVEQILASHPSVYGAGELDFMHRVLMGTIDMLGAGESEYPECLDGLSIDKADGMSQIYLAPLNALNPKAARITDKMPLNFLHLGLIAILLPEAKIIHCRRNPLDTCVSCYMASFTAGNDFKHDLTHLGQFYRQYDRLMAHWKSVLDSPILEVNYEDLIADPETQSRRLVEFLALPWDDRCLKFHETRRPVSTASVQQVRRPVYKSSIHRWRHYEKHLEPLQRALGFM